MSKKEFPITFVSDFFEDEKVVRLDDGYSRPDLPPGSAGWMSSVSGKEHVALEFTCPCGCGRIGAITVSQGQKEQNTWLWDGNVENPTLSPSIQKTSPCRWHGYLQNGMWVEC